MVYILLATGFETAEALAPADVLRRGNVPVSLVGVTGPTVQSAQGVTVTTDVALAEVTLAPGDMVMLPGGLGGVDALEHSEAAMALIRQAAADSRHLRRPHPAGPGRAHPRRSPRRVLPRHGGGPGEGGCGALHDGAFRGGGTPHHRTGRRVQLRLRSGSAHRSFWG